MRAGLRIERALPLFCERLGLVGKAVPEGALSYVTSRCRRIVAVDADLRAKTESTAAAFRRLLQSGEMPPPLNDDIAAPVPAGSTGAEAIDDLVFSDDIGA